MATITLVDYILHMADVEHGVASVSSADFIHAYPITHVCNNLFLGSKFSIERSEHRTHDITCAVNVGGVYAYPMADHGIEKYYTFAMEDDFEDVRTVVAYIDEALERIHTALMAGENVIVHCYSGMNRSALTCAAYLIRYMNLEPADAILHIRSGRPFALANPAFVRYLMHMREQQDRLA